MKYITELPEHSFDHYQVIDLNSKILNETIWEILFKSFYMTPHRATPKLYQEYFDSYKEYLEMAHDEGTRIADIARISHLRNRLGLLQIDIWYTLKGDVQWIFHFAKGKPDYEASLKFQAKVEDELSDLFSFGECAPELYWHWNTENPYLLINPTY